MEKEVTMETIISTFWSPCIQRICIIAGLTLSLGASATQSASSYTTATRYNLVGQVVGTISPDPDGGGLLPFPATRTTYSGGLPVKIESGALATWQSEAVLVVNWTGFSVATTQVITYDDLNRKATVTNKGSDGVATSLTQYSYDRYGRVSCKAERMTPDYYGSLPMSACTLGSEGSFGPDRITSYEYEDTFGQVNVENRAVGTGAELEQKYVTNKYDGLGLLVDQYDANGNQTHLEYYGSGYAAQTLKPKRMYFPDKKVAVSAPYNAADYEEYTYDANGNRRTLRKRDGKVITYGYDNLNRLITKDIPNDTTNDVNYEYDLLGLQTSATFSSGKAVSATFDGFGLVETETADINGVNKTVSHSYDFEGNRLHMEHPDAHYFDYVYDGLNRQTRIKDEWTTALIFNTYDKFARPATQSAVGGVLTTLDYDNASRLSSIDFQASGTVFDRYQSFGYNPANQVTDITLSNDLYKFKERGSKTGTYAVNGLNQYNSVGANAYGYDLNGNVICDKGYVETPRSCTGTTYTYDTENRLISASGERNVSLGYDPKGRLNVVTANGQSTFFLYSGDSLIAEYTSAKVGKRYVFGTGVDRPLLSYAADFIGSANRSFLHSNHQGSIVAVTDNTGAVTALNTYDAYGAPDSTVKGRFAYTGQAYIPELGMYYYKARIYYPQIGRFLQTDPIGYKDDMDLYSYVGNDPMNGTDPTGTYGMGTGWNDESWKKFNKVQQAAAARMEKAATGLNAKADKLDKGGKGGGDEKRAQANSLSAGAKALRSDGSDGKVANALSKGDYSKLPNATAAGAALADVGGSVINVNITAEVWTTKINNHEQQEWAVGHESLHTAGLRHLYIGTDAGYKFGTPAQQDAFDALEGTLNPDNLMQRAYPNL
ncbi:MAG: hypothetical protein EOO53_14115 [Gammaproteobacteria bacterium]|nr:MAG: hypothetical protein EOO53_14115 [Gammaproteobacteria bacterium]